MKKILLLIIWGCISSTIVQGQEQDKNDVLKVKIKGLGIKSDSLILSAGNIDPKYFRPGNNIFPITDSLANLKIDRDYAQMYTVMFSSDKNVKYMRYGRYFIDASTKNMLVDYHNESCGIVDGDLAKEYQKKFIPFFLQQYNCKENEIDKILESKALRFDTLLNEYIVRNPSSQVALWHLIERVSNLGHTALREQMLSLFSNKIRESVPYQILVADIANIKIKEFQSFPGILVQDVDLVKQNLKLPKTKYTLVDFWFSRCIPCIRSFPKYMEIYHRYQSKGFEMISVSTDKTVEINLWKKTIQQYNLPWLQFIDENAHESKRLGISSFPTTFLLDSNGVVLKKNPSTSELEIFLSENLTL